MRSAGTGFKQYGHVVKTILDIGCGTGNHSIPLARRGYQVTGVDLSENMLAHAREKARSSNAPPSLAFVQGDARIVDLNQKFDAVLMMFAVLGYQLTNEDVLAALNNVRKHLIPGGLFIFDVWYGPQFWLFALVSGSRSFPLQMARSSVPLLARWIQPTISPK